MGIFNWMASKAAGVPTVGEACDGGVIEFLAKHNVIEARYSFFKGEKSWFDQGFHTRVYAGTGRRGATNVGFLVSIDEHTGRPFGALVNQEKIGEIKQCYKEYLAAHNGDPQRSVIFNDEVISADFYGFALKRCGGQLEGLAQF